MTDTKHKANVIVYWAGKPVYCCQEHAKKLIGLGRFMGTPTPVKPYDGEEPCGNCANEAAKND